MNDKAAKVHAETAGKTGVYDGPWVGIMPVKEIISIRVSDHLKQDDDKVEQLTWGRVGGPDEAKPAGSPYPTFTNTQGSDTYDAVQFSVKLIMDQRDLMQFADELTRGRFHTLLRVSYVSNSDVFDRTYYGTVYGSEPTVNVLFDFESILPVDRYRAIMPDVVLEYLEVERPVTEEAGEEPAGETEQP